MLPGRDAVMDYAISDKLTGPTLIGRPSANALRRKAALWQPNPSYVLATAGAFQSLQDRRRLSSVSVQLPCHRPRLRRLVD